MKLIQSLLALSLTAALSACGGSSGGSSESSNSAPTAISLSSMAFDENEVATIIGTLSAADSDSSDTHTFTTSNTDFAISGTELRLADDVSVDYETDTSKTVMVTVTDSEGATYQQELTIEVNDMLDTYSFMSKFEDGQSSVSYSGQIARHVLIAELNNFIGNIETWLEANTGSTKADVLVELNKFYQPSEATYETLPITFTDAKQSLVSEISGSLKTISGKIAGNDAGGQEKDWNDGAFAGWGIKGSTTPEDLTLAWFDLLAETAVDKFNSGVADGLPLYVTDSGLDLKQLIQKHLLMAVTYSQATADYLGEDTDGKGLTTDNISAVSGKAYSNLEHQFDEGFGYFGAPVNYLAYSDDEIGQKGGRDEFQGQNDFNGDGEIDLISEYVFGSSANAAKRDRNTDVDTDITSDVMNAFLAGRKIINDAAGMALTDAEMTSLLAQRDIAVDAWEKAIAATVIHYINDTLADLETVGTVDFNLSDLAKHWSEMKGFGLGLQFNPYSDLTDSEFEQIHAYFQDAPVFDDAAPADVEDYIADLKAARTILQEALGFEASTITTW